MRSLAVLSFAAVLTAFIPIAALTAQTGGSTTARAVPFSETVHGIAISDEYRWMEDPATKDEWGGWVRTQSLRTRGMLDALPYRSEFADLFKTTASSQMRQYGYQRGGSTEVWARVLPGEQTGKLVVRDAKGVRVLVDPATAGDDKLTAMGSFSLSPDGKTVAVHLSTGGSEVGSVHFFDTATGKEPYPVVANVWGEGSASFLPGGMITYRQLAEKPIDGDALKGMTAWLRPLRGGAPVKVLGAGFPGANLKIEEFPGVYYSALSPYAIGIGGGARADLNAYVTKAPALLSGKPVWSQLATLDDRVNGMALLGDRLFTVTSKTNSARDLVVQRFGPTGRPGPAKVVLKGSDRLILSDVVATRSGIYLMAATDGVARLFFLPGGGTALREVKLPFEGTFSNYGTDGSESALILQMTGWTRSNSTYVVRGAQISAPGVESGVWSGAKDIVVERLEAVSADGTKVPLVVTRLRSATGRVPTLVEAYGGYGIDTATPFYNRNLLAFIAKGGAAAYCGVRGGGERGRAWHEGGRGPNKPRGQEDLIACAETLTAKGIAPTQGPIATGSSMAGALVPGAVLRKPQVFGGMITRVGIVNASRIGVAENGANQFAEIGDPADPQQFKDLLAMDAYQMITGSSSLPPTMMVIGMNDRRVAPWMTAKFVARAQTKWPNLPIWLRSDARAGHGVGTTEDVRRDEVADILAFAWYNQQAR